MTPTPIRSLREVASAAKRSWGFWTQSKLEILGDYLDGFLTASSKRARDAVYLDAFAGEGSGRDRITDEEFDGSARIAVGAVAAGESGFRFSYLRFIELSESRAREIRAEFERDFPGRDIDVVDGDCNQKLQELLATMPERLTWAPTFAFLDPFGIELHWQTISALADHKRNRKYKVELFMLFSSPAIMRLAGSSPAKASLGYAERLGALFGCSDWEPIVDARRSGKIGGAQAREAFVNLMRWRIAHDLGYERTHVLEFKNASGTPIYHMLFATDNSAGDRIMEDLYAKAALRNQDMAEDARQHKAGLPTLFLTSEFDVPKYVPYPPVPPAEYLRALLDAPSSEE
jgi:three-Cys-motif partner protein